MRLHPHEAERLESLYSYEVLDTPPEPAYDGLAHLAAMVTHAPIGLISLIDAQREWIKGAYGLAVTEVPRSLSFCNAVVAGQRRLVVPDALRDPRYTDHPAVGRWPHIRAYAGVPLIGRDGPPLGALCVLDQRSRTFSRREIEGLELLGRQTVAQLELRRLDVAAGRGPGTLLAEATDPLRLRRALANGEFVPHFQPIVELATGRVRGLEALLRWEHPVHGSLPPNLFLPAVESSRLMLPVGHRVLERSLRMLARLRADPRVPALLDVAVNFSGVQLQQPGVADRVLGRLRRHGIPPEHLSIEITETAPIFDPGLARRELTAMHEAGVRLALDDYGVGYSALGRLIELPLSTVKLDRSLVVGLPDDPRSVAVARSTITLAAEMGIDVVCEGIETDEQRDALLAMGAHYGQGWLFGRPMDSPTLIECLRRDTAVAV